MTLPLSGMSGIEWEAAGRVDPGLVAFIQAHVTVDPGNGNGSVFSKGFGALRRTQLKTLLRMFNVDIEREDLPLDELVIRANIAWSSGRFGDPKTWRAGGQPNNREIAELREQNRVLAEKSARLESIVAQLGEKFLAEKSPPPKSGRGPSAWNLLQRKAKELGIDIAGKNREALEAEIAGKEAA